MINKISYINDVNITRVQLLMKMHLLGVIINSLKDKQAYQKIILPKYKVRNLGLMKIQ